MFKNILLATTFSFSAAASTIAIIDSGTDLKHEILSEKTWVNAKEIPGNNRDEDRNGYEDDVNGWNFAGQSNEIINYNYLGLLNDDIKTFFEYQAKSIRGNGTPEETQWMRDMIKNEEFLKRISLYGNFMHGTHVAGISARKSDDAKILAIKLIPTEQKERFAEEIREKGFGDKIFRTSLSALAKIQMQMMEEIGYYVDGHGVQVANGSFGTGYPQSKMIVNMLYKTVMRKDLTDELQATYATFFIGELLKFGKSMPAAAPNTLFVFAAGNDGIDNDKYPTSPTNLQADNVISVAATIDYDGIASFSNFGVKMVDVAAPGVGIESSAPGGAYVSVSGTSQAAPFVAGVAGKILDINKSLKPVEVKKILMNTVDKKSFLVGKVSTQGIVNTDRAAYAARLSLTMSVSEAVSQAKVEVRDVKSNKSFNASRSGRPFVLPLPSSFKF